MRVEVKHSSSIIRMKKKIFYEALIKSQSTRLFLAL